MSWQKFLIDNGFKSRKFLIVLLSVIIISILGVTWAWVIWPTSLFDIITSSIVTLALGFCGINATRAALPISASMFAKILKPKQETTGNTEDLQP